ncbi:MAG TPA: D-lyxose/D-mannose family sugar isomerase, partial [Spirochaeta sp.]|nr:D-lyxose/D-mannose family sugar isomerase [Spirochaeta sp.]
MKRSEINGYIKEAEQLFRSYGYKLPPWAEWPANEWAKRKEECESIFKSCLGWDLTDF